MLILKIFTAWLKAMEQTATWLDQGRLTYSTGGSPRDSLGADRTLFVFFVIRIDRRSRKATRRLGSGDIFEIRLFIPGAAHVFALRKMEVVDAHRPIIAKTPRPVFTVRGALLGRCTSELAMELRILIAGACVKLKAPASRTAKTRTFSVAPSIPDALLFACSLMPRRGIGKFLHRAAICGRPY